MSALSSIRVVELAGSVAGEYCGKLLADFGAEVIKVEAPGCGSPTRAMAPILADGCDGSGLFAYLNTNKLSVVLDGTCPADVATLDRLIGTADAVVDDDTSTPWSERQPDAVVCSITPYGRDVPVEIGNARSLNVFHASGWGYHTPSHADPGKPPLQGPGRFLTDYEAGLDAALCVVSSLFRRLHTGQGEFIDVSQQAVLTSRTDCILGRFITGEVTAEGDRGDYDQAGPASFFPCSDGFVYLYMTNRVHWLGVKKLMEHPEWLDAFDDDWLEFSVTAEKVATFRRGFAAWVRHLEKDTAAEQAQRLGVPLVPVNGAADLHKSPQYLHRGFFQPVRHPVLGDAAYPTVPYAFSASPARIDYPAPSLGQHTEAVLNRQYQSRNPQRRPGHQVGRGHGAAAHPRRPQRHRHQQPASRSHGTAGCGLRAAQGGQAGHHLGVDQDVGE